MGKYDNIPPDRIREALLRFALLVVRLEKEGVLLDAVPDLQSLMGDLRRMLFAHEVRGAPESEEETSAEDRPRGARSGGDGPDRKEPLEGEGMSQGGAGTGESLRIVREALERERDFLRELEESGPTEEDEEESET